jgi:tripartite-type tricarboxylate transporter receptor subunit TctC
MMNLKLPRRKFLHLAAGAAVLPAVSRVAKAQVYPAGPVRIIVGSPPGGAPDILARFQLLTERLSPQFIIDIRTGDGGNIATEAVVRAPADGYTLLLVTPANAINATLYQKLNFNLIRDIAPVASILRVPYVMGVNLSVPAKTVPEFIAYAKANPGKISYGSDGNGTTSHMSGELFKLMTGVNMVHVPYRGAAPAMTDLVGGQIQCYFSLMSWDIEQVRAGRVRPIAVTSRGREEALPDVPTVAASVPGYESSTWVGIGAPRNTPAEIIEMLNRKINAALADARFSSIVERLADLGITVTTGSPADFGNFIADETEKWAKVIKFANIKPE